MLNLNEALREVDLVIVDSIPEHCTLLAPRLRKGDLIEIEQLGLPARKAVYRSYRNSFYRKTAFINGEIAGMAGLSGGLFSNVVIPWMLTTDLVEKHPIHFMRTMRAEFQRARESFPILSNQVAAEYTQAIRLIKWLGFEVGEPNEIAPGCHTRTFTYKHETSECA